MWGRGVLPAALPAPLSATLSPALLVYLCECGAAGSARGQTACPCRPTLLQSRSCHSNGALSTPVPVSTPPTGLDECLFFYVLGVRLPCRSILCQFWLCQEAQCVYLRLHLGSPGVFIFFTF